MTKFNWIEFELRMQAQRAEYMDVFCKSGVVNCCDESPDYVALHPGYNCRIHVIKAIEPLEPRKEQGICPQINADEHG